MPRVDKLPLNKYHAVFVASYLAASFVVTVLQFMKLRFLAAPFSLVAVGLAGWMTLKWFISDQGRGLYRHEAAELMRIALIVIGGLSFLGMLMIKAVYDRTLMGMFRPMPAYIVVVAPLLLLGLTWLELKLVYGVINARYAPDEATLKSAASVPAPVARVRVLVPGSGVAAHALAWKLAQSPHVSEVLVAPGNAGTAAEKGCRNVDAAADDGEALLALAKREDVPLVVLVKPDPATVERLRASGVAVVGAHASALRVETEPAFLADLAHRHGIPHADEDEPGTDVHVVALADGRVVVPLATVQAVTTTPGAEPMAASPAPLLPPALLPRVVRDLLEPLVLALQRETSGYTGFLELRVRVGTDGALRLAGVAGGLDDRFAPAWLLRIQSDLFELADNAAARELSIAPVRVNPRTAAAQALQARTALDAPVRGLDARLALGTRIFHGATRRDGTTVRIAGPHVLSVAALGADAGEAGRGVAEAVLEVSWDAPAATAA